ncbi:MAG TPA: acyl carrier protein [Anaeromyxobacter sp.]|nr:acyl carrier protein [Anaeromyxobacter sp.]
MEQTLRNIVAKIAEIPPDFDAQASFRDKLGVDSVRALEIVFEIEKTLGLVVPEDGYAKVKSFDNLLTLIQSIKK